MSKKAQVYIGERARWVLGALRADESLSGRINAVIDRYGVIMERARPQLTDAEWAMLRAATISWATTLEPAEVLLGGLVAEMEDAAAAGDLNGQDVAPLVARIAAMPPAERLAVIERLEREAGEA